MNIFLITVFDYLVFMSRYLLEIVYDYANEMIIYYLSVIFVYSLSEQYCIEIVRIGLYVLTCAKNTYVTMYLVVHNMCILSMKN